jgi:hypothetical protein
MRRTSRQQAQAQPAKPKSRKTTAAKKPAWNDSLTDLSAHRLPKNKQMQRKLARKSPHLRTKAEADAGAGGEGPLLTQGEKTEDEGKTNCSAQTNQQQRAPIKPRSLLGAFDRKMPPVSMISRTSSNEQLQVPEVVVDAARGDDALPDLDEFSK